MEDLNGFVKVNKETLLKLCKDLTIGVWEEREEEFYKFIEEMREKFFTKRRFFGILPPRKYSNDGEILDFAYKHTEDTDYWCEFKVNEVNEYSRLDHERHRTKVMILRNEIRTALEEADKILLPIEKFSAIKTWEIKDEE